MVLAICGVLAILTGAVMTGVLGNLRSASGESADDQARYIAQAGVQAALARLSRPRNWPSAAQPKGEGNVWSTVDYNYEEDHLGLWSNSNPDLHAAILVYNNTSDAFHRTPQGPDGTDIPEGRILIVSSGIVGSDARGERQSTTVAALAKPAGVMFEDALLGGNKVKVNNSYVDVIDSSTPGWTPATYSPYDIMANPVKAAGITSNNTTTNSIEFDATSIVDGDVYSGPNSNLGAIGYYGAQKTGIDGALGSARDLNVMTVPPTATQLGSWNADYAAGPTVITGGTYHVKGDLNIASGAVITLTSTTTLYVDGNINIDDAKVNMNGKPWHLQIFMTGGSGTTATIKDSSTSLLVSGPNADVQIDNSHLFGAAIGGQVDVKDSGIHYDRAVDGLYLGSIGWVTDVFLNSATVEKLEISAPPGGAPPDPFTVRPSLPVASGPTPGPGAPGPSLPGPDPADPVDPPPSGNPNPDPPSDPPPSTPSPGGGGVRPGIDNPKCCLDYSCGPPMCHIF